MLTWTYSPPNIDVGAESITNGAAEQAGLGAIECVHGGSVTQGCDCWR